MDKVIAAIKANGGKIEPWEGKEKWEMKGLGWFSRATDTEGMFSGCFKQRVAAKVAMNLLR